jgi:hypothetical protein
MSMQMYIITLKGGFSQDASRDVQRHVRHLGGYILMVTTNGPIVAIDDSRSAAVNRHPAIAYMGAVTLNPHGRAAQALQNLFAENLSKQITLPPSGNLEPEKPLGGRYVGRTRPT